MVYKGFACCSLDDPLLVPHSRTDTPILHNRKPPPNTSPRTSRTARLPVGAVIPFYLTPDEVKRLEPVWIPAIGQSIGKTDLSQDHLPDLQGRMAIGAQFDGPLNYPDVILPKRAVSPRSQLGR